MLNLIIKSVLLFFIILLVLRIMGKRQIGEMQPFELAITLIVAEVAAVPMSDNSIPFSFGLIPILTLTTVHFLLSFIARKSLVARGIICGKPVVVITPSGVDFEKLKSLNMTMHDLLEAARGQGYFNLEEIEYAIFETNGKLCVLPKTKFAPATKQDVGAKADPACVPLTLIVDGKYLKEHLKQMNVTEEIINRELKKSRIKDTKDVALVTINEQGSLYIQPKNKQFITRKISI